MAALGRRLQNAPRRIRWPVKWLMFATVVFGVLYPYPSLLPRHVRNWRRMDRLPDPEEPLLQPLLRDFDAHLAAEGVTPSTPAEWLKQVQVFVHERIRYKYDWETWGVVDYLPTLDEVIRRGEEDCDGRAVLAAAIIRARIGEARIVGGLHHLWVSTPIGDTMGPMGEPSLASSPEGMRVRWSKLISLGQIAVGVSLFPLGREAVILITGWLLLLPADFRKGQALLGLLLLIEAWIIMRLAGVDPRQPNHWAACWAAVHVLAAIVILNVKPRFFGKDTGRSVLRVR